MGVTKFFLLNGKRFTVTSKSIESGLDSSSPRQAQDELRSGMTSKETHGFLKKQSETFSLTQEDGSVFEYHVSQIENTSSHATMSLLINNQMHRVTCAADGDVFVQGKKYAIQEQQQVLGVQESKALQCRPASVISQSHIKSPLAGRVVRVLSSAGAAVLAGQPLVVIESMKMENEICASRDGIIKTLFIALGNLVQPNQPLVELEMKGGRDADPENTDGQATI